MHFKLRCQFTFIFTDPLLSCWPQHEGLPSELSQVFHPTSFSHRHSSPKNKIFNFLLPFQCLSALPWHRTWDKTLFSTYLSQINKDTTSYTYAHNFPCYNLFVSKKFPLYQACSRKTKSIFVIVLKSNIIHLDFLYSHLAVLDLFYPL